MSVSYSKGQKMKYADYSHIKVACRQEDDV